MLASMSLLVFFASVLALPMPFITSPVMLIVVFGLLVFMLGGIMPLLSSAILLTVKENERLVANSIATTFTLLLGLIPSTYTYGLLSHILTEDSTVPMTVTLYATVFSSSLLMIGLVVSLKRKA
jgi:MFS family permease